MFTYQTIIQQLKALQITDLTIDARQANLRTAFIALPGTQRHGLDYLDQALANQATCLIIDAKENSNHKQLVTIKVPDLINQLGYFAAAFYDYPSEKLAIHAITGTNGKTSCSQFIAQTFAQLNQRCGVIGTLGVGVYPNLTINPNTTPDAVQIQRFLSQMVDAHVDQVSMEVSSIALAANRMQACQIRTAIFTNLTQDHLDYHGSMENYGAAKKRLFALAGLQQAIINADDPFGQRLLADFAHRLDCIAYSTKTDLALSHCSTLTTQNYQLTPRGISATVKFTPPNNTQSVFEFDIHSTLIGVFNLSNLLAMTAWLITQKVPTAKISAIIPTLQAANGRMQCLNTAGKPMLVIDYAHTPDALSQTLTALRAHCQGHLWCVFGCGGNRDKTKRPLMGQIAKDLADYVVITNDNPRFEMPEAIIEDILAGMSDQHHVQIQSNRRQAIEYAIKHANAQDIILIAGKGHENYQDIQGQKHHFSDLETAQQLLIPNKDAD